MDMNLYDRVTLLKIESLFRELQRIEYETYALADEFPLLLKMWNASANHNALREAYENMIDILNGTIETSFEMHTRGEYVFSYKKVETGTTRDSTTHVDVYSLKLYTLFTTLTQLLAYHKYGIVDDLRRVQEQERNDHIQYLLDIGCTEQELIRAGLLDITIPISACSRRATNKLYSN